METCTTTDPNVLFNEIITQVPLREIPNVRAAIMRLTDFSITYEQISLKVFNGQITAPAVFYRIKQTNLKYAAVLRKAVNTQPIDVAQILGRLNVIATNPDTPSHEAVKAGSFLISTIVKLEGLAAGDKKAKEDIFLKKLVSSMRV